MAHRKRQKEFVPEPLGITATPDGVRIKLECDYREAVGLAQIEQVLKSDRGFCLITCFRADRGFAENYRAFMQMTREFQGLTARPDLGAYWLIAHWVEPARAGRQDDQEHVGCDPRAEHSIEYSWLFTQPPDLDDDEWLLAAQLLAQAHEQPAFILRAHGDQIARLYGADGRCWGSLCGADEVLPTAKVLTFLRSRGETWGQANYDRLASRAPGDAIAFPAGSFLAVHPATEAATAVGPEAISLYAVTPHNNSARMLFSYMKVWKGG